MARRTVALFLGLWLALLLSMEAGANCNVIPGPESEFRGALGSLNRPFAIPGDEGERIILELGSCDSASPGFTANASDHVVTVLFTPPAGAANAVVLSTDCSALTSELLACETQLSGGSATCIEVNGGAHPNGLAIVDPAEGPRQLRFRFPDTDALVDDPDDDRTLSGPATIAVTAAGPPADPLPCGLATTRCADSSGLIACVDELYARDGSCETTSGHRDPIFAHFTALPPANDYQALCTTADTECTGLATELRLTVDAQGNALIPIDWRGVLLRPHGLPVPRLARGDTTFAAFSSGGDPVRIPGRSFLATYSAGGRRLPPIFEPLADPASEDDLTLFGSVDAPFGVIRVARRMPDLTGLDPIYRECTGGDHDGLPCVLAEECPGGSCGATTCWAGGVDTGTSCTNDGHCSGGECGPSLFDLTDRFAGGGGGGAAPAGPMGAESFSGAGPVLISSSEYTLNAESPVPIEGLIETPEMFAFMELEAIGDSTVSGPDSKDLNGDGDETDPVVVLRDRETGVITPIGESGSIGRAATRVREPPFSYPAMAVEDDIVAFLELEPLQFAQDANLDGDVFDAILRVYRLNPDCGGGTPCAEELISGLNLAVDAASMIDGRSLVLSEGKLYFRSSEAGMALQETTMVSVASDETQGNDESYAPSISADGSSVAFHSRATNLVANDTNGYRDVFVRDRTTGETTRVAAAIAGSCLDAALSDAGEFVAFESAAAWLVPGDTNGVSDVFVHNRDADGDGTFDEQSEPGAISTVRVSVDSYGNQVDRPSYDPSISADGRLVAFESHSDDLVEGDTSGYDKNIFVHDLVTSETTRVSVASDGSQANDGSDSNNPVISADGLIVAFESEAANLVAGDTNGLDDIFVHDRATGETTRVSVATDGSEGNGYSRYPAISADGRFVAFESYAGNLVAGDTGGRSRGGTERNIFVHDRTTGETTRVSVASDGSQGDGASVRATISADGRFLAFWSGADNLVENDAWLCGLPPTWANCWDIFVHDRLTGATKLVSVASDGTQGNDGSSVPAISADGYSVAFQSGADNLVDGDTQNCDVYPNTYNCEDVFLRGPVPGDLESDLNGDFDLDDIVLQVIDTQVAHPESLALGAAEQVSVAAGAAAFLLPESASGADRNSDGDTEDAFVRLSVGGGSVQDLGKEAIAIAMSSELLVALVPSGPAGETFVEIYDWASPSPGWTAVGPEADLADTVGSVVVLRAAATKELQLYDASTAVLTPLGEEAEEFVLGAQILAFRTSEADAGDLNDDGDSADDVLQVYDLVSAQLMNTGQAVIPCRMQACNPRVPYRVAGDTVTFLTLEADQGKDLNGDDDSSDLVLQTFNARAEEIAEVSVAALAGTVAGLCNDTGEVCADDADCPAGSCFVPPGGCIEDLGTACSCDDVGCTGCSGDEFCVPTVGGGGAGTCHENQGPCQSDADCTSPAICEDEGEDIVRLFGPLAEVEDDGRQVFVSAGLATQATGTACLEDSDCSTGEVCTEAGTCEDDRKELISTGAPDTDGDGAVDPFDNCPHRPNADQADSDGDGVGDGCSRTACRDGDDNDGDGLTDLADGGCLTADDPSEEHACSDGLDNDGDGRVDFDPATYASPGDETTPPGGEGDPGCGAPTWSTESPACQDGIDNDGDGKIDHDAGLFANGAADPAGPDSECVGRPWWNSEAPWSGYCGLGVELVLLLPLLWLRRKRMTRGASSGEGSIADVV